MAIVWDDENPQQAGIVWDDDPAQQSAQHVQSRYNPFGAMEFGATIASGVIAEPVAGLAGIVQALNPAAPPGAGAQAVQAVRDAMTYQPHTEAGRQFQQVMAPALKPAGDAITAINNAAGGVGYMMAGPVGGAIGEAVPTAAMQIPGVLAGLSAAARSAQSADMAAVAQAAKNTIEGVAPGSTAADIRAALLTGQPNVNTIGYKLAQPELTALTANARAGIAAEPLGRTALKAGVDRETLAIIDRADPLTRQKMGQMVRITHGRLVNPAMRDRAGQIAGQSINARLKVLEAANKIAGHMVSQEAKKLTGTVSMPPVVGKYLQKLDSLGVTVGEDGLNFAGSALEMSPSSQSALQDVYSMLTRGENVPAITAHHMKKAVTKKAQFGASIEGVDAETANIIKSVRADLNQAIGQGRPAYANANKHYADTVDALNGIARYFGEDIDFADPAAARHSGVISRRIMSNAVSGQVIDKSLENITDMARRYLNGDVKDFPTKALRFESGVSPAAISDDIFLQSRFAAQLEKRFGAQSPTSIQGVGNAVAERAADMALTGGISPSKVAKAALDLTRKNTRAADAQQLKALRDYVSRQRGQ